MHVENPEDALPPVPPPPVPDTEPTEPTETTVLGSIAIQYATGPVLWAVVPRRGAGDEIGWNLMGGRLPSGAMRGIVRGMLEHALRELDRADQGLPLGAGVR
jgi:hypothetical protein